MAVLTSRYSRWQREAVWAAYALTSTTARQVAERAAAGELEHLSGARLGPFDIPENTVRSTGRRARLREAADQRAQRLADMEPRDAVERMRVQLAEVIEIEFDRIEIEQSGGRPVAGEVIRQLTRAVGEFASIPGPNDPRPPAPGAKVNGTRDGGEMRGGLAGKICERGREGGDGLHHNSLLD